MASNTVSSVLTEKQEKSADKFPIVILDSDEEGEQTTSDLFQTFVAAAQPYLERKEILLLRVKFAELRPDFARCLKFKEMLRRKANQVRETDVYIHFNEILNELINNPAVYGMSAGNPQIPVTGVQSHGESTSVGSTIEQNELLAPKFKKVDGLHDCNEEIIPTTSSKKTSKTKKDNFQVIDLEDQSSSQEFESPRKLHLIKEEQQRMILKRKRKKHVAKLETRLKYISEEIKRLSETELSLEEMDLADSNYMKESKLKGQFNKLWNRICKIKGRPPDTGRVVEQKIKIKGTKFPAIDNAVQKFLSRKKGSFPDIFDIRNITIKANKKHNLGLPPSVLQEIAADLFTDIGNKIQKKRKKDYEYNFGCHLTDDYLSSLDPALNNNSLRRKLEENKRVNERALDTVFEKYVHLGRIKGQNRQESDSSSASSSEDYDKEERNNRKNARKRKRQSSDGYEKAAKCKGKKIRHRQVSASASSTINEPVMVDLYNSESDCDEGVIGKPSVSANKDLTKQCSQPDKAQNDYKDNNEVLAEKLSQPVKTNHEPILNEKVITIQCSQPVKTNHESSVNEEVLSGQSLNSVKTDPESSINDEVISGHSVQHVGSSLEPSTEEFLTTKFSQPVKSKSNFCNNDLAGQSSKHVKTSPGSWLNYDYLTVKSSKPVNTPNVNIEDFAGLSSHPVKTDPKSCVKDDTVAAEFLPTVQTVPESNDVHKANEKITQSSPTSILQSTSSLKNKLNINSSKLHSKIRELRNKQLSLQTGGIPEQKSSTDNLDMSKSNILTKSNASDTNNTEFEKPSTSKKTNENNQLTITLDKISISNVTKQPNIILSPRAKKLLSQATNSHGCSPTKNSNDINVNGFHTNISKISVVPTSSNDMSSSPLGQNGSCSHSVSSGKFIERISLLNNSCDIQEDVASPPKRVCHGLTSVINDEAKVDTEKERKTIIILSDDED